MFYAILEAASIHHSETCMSMFNLHVDEGVSGRVVDGE